MNWQEEYQKWVANDKLDSTLRKQLTNMETNEKNLKIVFIVIWNLELLGCVAY